MKKLNDKLITKPSKETDHKRETTFPFRILAKEKEILQFSNSAIEKYKIIFFFSNIFFQIVLIIYIILNFL